MLRAAFWAGMVFLAAASCADTGDSSPPPASTATPAATAATEPADGPLSPHSADLQPALVTRVVDGDTIDVLIDGEEFRVRYIGIDTAETVDPRRPVQCFGREASGRNRELVEDRTVGLERDVSETDSFGRLLRYVWLDGEMVNALLVAEGYALASTYPPDLRYADLFLSLQREAQAAGRGLWEACAEPSPTAPAAGGTCDYSGTAEPVIKGNISYRTGEKIYHVPGGEYYDDTVINEPAGERWFCTEPEAVAAGWRKSLR